MSKSKIFIGIAVSFAVGILVASGFDISRGIVYIILGFCCVGFAGAFLNQSKVGALVAVFLFCMGLGVFKLQMTMVPNEYQDILDTKHQMEGFVVEEPAIKSNLQTVTFQPKNFHQRILVTTTLAQEFFYGDLVVVDGKIQEPKVYGDFDYQKYLQRFNIYATAGYPKILILKNHQLNPGKEFLLKVKAAFIHRLGQLFREPQNSLAVGILIGGHASLPQSIVDNFSRTGVSHIIAVSGFNITIIILAVASLAFMFGRRPTFWLGVGTIISFVIITGASASVLRAAIMGFLLLISINIGRQYSVVPALFCSAFIMLLFNPKILFWDVGFQLSFAATLGIIYFFPLLNKLAESLPEAAGGKNLILTTLSAIIATMPIILFNFGTLSLSAPIVNVLVLPAVPFAMLFGFLAVLPFVGPGFALLANWLLVYILKVINFFASLPYSSLNFQISIWMFWGLILGVFGLYFLLRYLANKRVVDK